MTPQELIAALEANADRASKPVTVQLPGVGTIYVRRRTVAEFEAMAEVANVNGSSKFGPALARLLCDENGARLPAETRDQLADLLGRQPDTVFHAIVNAADDTKGSDAGN